MLLLEISRNRIESIVKIRCQIMATLFYTHFFILRLMVPNFTLNFTPKNLHPNCLKVRPGTGLTLILLFLGIRSGWFECTARKLSVKLGTIVYYLRQKSEFKKRPQIIMEENYTVVTP